MSVIQTFPFTDSINYSFSDAEISAGKAQLGLIDNTGQNFTQAFTSDSGFTYDNTKAEFVGGLVRQKSQIKDMTFTSVTGLTVVSNTLEKLGVGGAFNADAISVEQIASGDGYVEFTLPLADKDLSAGMSADDPDANFTGIDFSMYFSTIGQVHIIENGTNLGVFNTYVTNDVFRVEVISGTVYYKKNGTIFYTSLNAPSYPLFFDCSFYTQNAKLIDLKILNTSLYVANKVDLPNFSYTGIGTVQAVESSTFTETGTPRYIVGGKYWNGSAWVVSNGSYAQANTSAAVIANLTALVVTGATSVPVSVVFDDSSSQSSVDLIDVTVTGQKYSLLGYLEPAQGLQVQDLESYSQTVTVDADTAVKIIIKVDGILKWWNGSAWVTSDGTEAQSNDADDVNDNFPSLLNGTNSTVFIRWLLVTTDQQKTPLLDEAIVNYDFGAVETLPDKCLVYGYIKDISGNPIPGITLNFELKKSNPADYREASNNVILSSVSCKTNSSGYFEMDLIRSSEYETTGVYRLSLSKNSKEIGIKTNDGRFLEFEVPDADTKDLTDLLTVV